MVKKEKRTHKENIAHIERAIRRFGDSDGKRTKALETLRADKAHEDER